MSQSCDGLHLNGVPLLQGVVQYSRGVHHLLSIKKQKFWIKSKYLKYRQPRNFPTELQADNELGSVPASGGICSPCDPQTGT